MAESPDRLHSWLLDKPENADREWYAHAAEILRGSWVYGLDPDVILGPDRKYYFAVQTIEQGASERTAPFEIIFPYLYENRIGLAVFAGGLSPALQLDYGRVLSWSLYGTPFPPRFWDAPDDSLGSFVLTENKACRVGPPNEQMLPPVVRAVLRDAMRDFFGIKEPRVGVVHFEGARESRLVLDLDPAALGGVEAGYEAYKSLMWFMPYCIPSYYVPGMAGAEWMVPL